MIKRSIFVLLILIFINSAIVSENKEITIGKFLVSVEVGPETGMSIIIPKLSFYFYDPWLKSFYLGADVTIGVFIVCWFASSITAGFQFYFITIDNSISYFTEPYNMETHITYNPKIGIQFFNLLFRIVPSFILYKNKAGIVNMLNYYFAENIGLNIELSLYWNI